MFATIVSRSYHDLPDSISVSTHIGPHTWMTEYDSDCISRSNWCDLVRVSCSISEPEPLNAFDSIGAILAERIEDELLEAAFWDQSAVPSLGMCTGQKLPHTEDAWNTMTRYLETVGLCIGAPTLGLIVTLNNLCV